MTEAEMLERLSKLFPTALRKAGRPLMAGNLQRDMSDASRLKITRPEDVWDYVCLRYRTAPLALSPVQSGAVALVMRNLDWPPRKRFDFIHKHVIARPARGEPVPAQPKGSSASCQAAGDTPAPSRSDVFGGRNNLFR